MRQKMALLAWRMIFELTSGLGSKSKSIFIECDNRTYSNFVHSFLLLVYIVRVTFHEPSLWWSIDS